MTALLTPSESEAAGPPPGAARDRAPDEFTGLLSAARRRLRLAWLLATSTEVLPWAAGLALIVAAIGWLRPWKWPEPVAIGVLVLTVLALLVGAFALRISDHMAAVALDRGLGTNDAVTTAVAIDPGNPFSDRIYQRARHVTPPQVPEAIPLIFNARRWLAVLGLLVLLVAALVLRNPQDDIREQQAAEAAAVEEVAEILEAQAEELGTEPATQQLASDLAALAEELRRESDLESALEDLENASADLTEQIDADALAQRAAAEGLAQTLEANPLAPGEGAAAQLQALADAVSDLSDEEREALAERLEQLAETQETGDAETSDALANAAEALAAGDAAAAAAALNSAAGSAGEAAAGAAAGRTTDSVATDLNNLQRQLENQQGQGQGQGEGQGQGQGEGQGQGQGQGEGQGQGQGQGEGQGQGQGEGQGQGQGQGEGQGQGQGQGQGEGQGQGAGQGQGQAGGNPSGAVGGGSPGGGGAGQGGVGNPVGNGIDDDNPGNRTPTDTVIEGGESEILEAAAVASGDEFTSTPVNQLNAGGEAGVAARDVVDVSEASAVEALDRLQLAPSEASAVESYFDKLRGG